MIHIKVPATTANIGPGFDTLGLALAMYHEIRVKHSLLNCSLIEWSHVEQILPDEENLVVHGIHEVFKVYGASPVTFELQMLNCDIPASRGLGSSAAAYVSGVVAGLYLLNLPIDKQTVFKIASKLEGHPDNVAPAVFGGMTASCMTNCDAIFQPIQMGKPLQFIALIPECKLSTAEARSVLPDVYSKSEVVYSLSHLSILISAIQNGAHELLRIATQDILHQPHRLSLMPDSTILKQLSNADLFYGGFVSGAGSTYMLMCDPLLVDSCVVNIKQHLSSSSANWDIRALNIDFSGTSWEVA